MASVTTQAVSDVFKRVYGDLKDLIPNNTMLGRDIAFSQRERVGDSFLIALALAAESGMTWAGTGQSAFSINPAVSNVVQQARIIPSQSVMQSVVAWAYVSRSLGSEAAFYNGTKLVVKNNLESHERLLEIARLYGQSDKLLGYVSYAPSGTVYRGATYTGAGDVTLTRSDGTTIAFTDGVNVAEKAILLAPGNYAAGIWVGKKGIRVLQLDSNKVVLASGGLVSTDTDLGILYVDFVPVAPTAVSGAGSVRMAFENWDLDNEAVGMHKILSNAGSLFGINASQYELWKSNVLNLGGKRLNLKAIQLAVANAQSHGGLDQPLKVYVNPRTYANLQQDEAAMRKYDSSYSSDRAKNGFQNIVYYAATGEVEIVGHPCVMEGDAFAIVKDNWIRSGSAQIAFKIPGFDQAEPIFPLENQAAFALRSFSDQFLLCEQPAKQILFSNINDEAVGF